MKKIKIKTLALCFAVIAGNIYLLGCKDAASSNELNLTLNDSAYFETRGLDVLVFSNLYDNMFDDSKISGVELIHHGVRTVTNGDVRLNPTPGQWDAIPEFVERRVDRENKRIVATLKYAKYDFQYNICGEARDGGFYLSVHVDKPVPEALIGIAGLNLEFTPASYFEKSYIMDGKTGLFPLYPSDLMQTINGETEPVPFASGSQLALAPDDIERHITITKIKGDGLMLFDGRNKAQNGLFVVRTMLPPDESGEIVEWFITASVIPEWTRKPVIAHSQVGYHPSQQKIAVIELDKNDRPKSTISLLKINSDGSVTKALTAKPQAWGNYLRYNYLTFDFSSVKEEGIYTLEYGNIRTAPFPVATDVYEKAWHPTADVFFPVQMDHVFVREAYRVWHGASHLDDALQAPLNRSHWDGWRQGESTGNKYKPLEHIPGLNVGGWFDAGDFDIQTLSQQWVIQSFVDVWETFNIHRDETTIDQKTRYVEIHLPDEVPDILQQIEHGVLQLVAQVKAVGYAIQGINESHLYQYRHLGDAVTKTDNLVYNPRLDSLQTDGRTSGTFDDRWAFTNESPFFNYGTAVSLAGASRTLKYYNHPLSKECISIAEKLWKDEHSRKPLDVQANNNGGFDWLAFMMSPMEFRAAFELWRATENPVYKTRMDELLPEMEQSERNIEMLARIAPYMDAAFKQRIEPLVKNYAEQLAETSKLNPFGVMISTASWAGNRNIIQTANTCFMLHRIFPELIDVEYVYRGLNYIYGCHPDSDISFVSAVGAQSKKVAYGNNRADFSFIAGGVVPGLRILNPDFPENRNDYPFIWSENEYVIDVAANYIFLVNAVNELLMVNDKMKNEE
jgi:hypothetical protein